MFQPVAMVIAQLTLVADLLEGESVVVSNADLETARAT